MIAHPGSRFRERRMALFLERMRPAPSSRILDVGGNPQIWESIPKASRPAVTFLNLPRAFEPGDDPARLVFADGTRLPFADACFDIAFSNSVIEHVGDDESQTRFAREIQRVAGAYWVQTPNRLFPIEQHLLTPLIHWLPKSVQRVLVPRANLWRWIAKPSPDQAQFYYEHFLNDIRLLDATRLRRLFPAGNLLRERYWGFTKSLIIYKS